MAQGNELSLAIQGWKHHFKHPHRIVIIGAKSSHLIKEDVAFVFKRRFPDYLEGQYLPHLDILSKLRAGLEAYPCERFIYACDDIYAVNDFGLEEVECLKVQDWVMPDVADDEPNGWWRDLAKTKSLCKSLFLDLHNWVCHLPVLFDAEKFVRLVDWTGCAHESYVFENLYYNHYFKGRIPLVLKKDNPFRYSVQNEGDLTGIDAAFRSKIWITNSVNGWSEALEAKLWQHYDSL